MNVDAMDPQQYDAQLDVKRQKLAQLFVDFETPELEVFEIGRAHV